MNNTASMPLIGMAVGMVLGLAGAFGGLGAFLLVLVLGAVGFLVGRIVVGGEISLPNLTVKKR